MKNVLFIPIDNRPVCFDLVKEICKIDSGIKLFMPEAKWLADLKKNAQVEKIVSWVKNIEVDFDFAVVCLDTIAYGGLISSRFYEGKLKKIKNRMYNFFQILRSKNVKKIYAFSSIMRISNNNVNIEEKRYWKYFGEKIFQTSVFMHKNSILPSKKNRKKLKKLKNQVPLKTLQDYTNTRKRNFKINNFYLELALDGLFEKLIFSLDDCNPFGLNVLESIDLEKKIKKKNLSQIANTKTGADEIPLVLLSCAYSDLKKIKTKIAILFSNEKSTMKISRYENISVKDSAESQIKFAGCEVSDFEESDLIMFVNNFEKEQGDLVMNIFEPSSKANLPDFEKPFFVVDILNANGSDYEFVQKNLSQISNENCLAYSGWNTTSNSLGSAIATSVFAFYNQKSREKIAKAKATRLLDDFAYQSFSRQELQKSSKLPNAKLCAKIMKPFEEKIFDALNLKKEKISYSFPLERFFEVRIKY